MATKKKSSTITRYAFKLENCKVPHWIEGEVVKCEEGYVLLGECSFRIKEKDVYSNREDALIDYIKAIEECKKNNITGFYGKEDLAAYSEGKNLLDQKKIANKSTKK